MRPRALPVATLVLALACADESPAPVPESETADVDPVARSLQLAEAYVDGYYDQFPEEAYEAGYPDAPADRLSDRTPAALAILDRMADVGLGYLRLGQPLTTLSGGERQRLKLAIHMATDGGIYVLDEPTTGLHLADVENLLCLLDRLVDAGKSVIVIEHHLAVMAHADWIIDLGPGAGHDGGRIVFEGTPADLVAAANTLTGQHLKAYVGA